METAKGTSMEEQTDTPVPEASIPDAGDSDNAVSRRGFLRGLGAAVATSAVIGGGLAVGADEAEAAAPGKAGDTLTGSVPVALTVNGAKRTATVDVRRTLLEMLRTDFDLTGTKLVCNQASCGACTVHLDGKPVYACTTLAVDADGKRVETVEGLARGDHYHALQTAFVEHDALMCGFCTPGFLMSSKALLDKNPRPTLADVKNACAGNICRCGTYPRIFEAVLAAAEKGANHA